MDLFDGSTSEEDDGDTVGEVVAELARLVPPVGAVKPVIVVAPDVDGAYEDRALQEGGGDIPTAFQPVPSAGGEILNEPPHELSTKSNETLESTLTLL